MTPADPELDVVVAACVRSGGEFVVVGGFAVIAHRHVRATEVVDVLIPDGRICGWPPEPVWWT